MIRRYTKIEDVKWNPSRASKNKSAPTPPPCRPHLPYSGQPNCVTSRKLGDGKEGARVALTCAHDAKSRQASAETMSHDKRAPMSVRQLRNAVQATPRNCTRDRAEA